MGRQAANGRWIDSSCGAEADTDEQREFIQAVGKKWLVSAVAHIPAGVQSRPRAGARRPTGRRQDVDVRHPWRRVVFGKSTERAGIEEHAPAICGRWIIELSDSGQFTEIRNERSLKNYISRTTERFRPPYGRHDVDFPRQCVFGGSTNAGPGRSRNRRLADSSGGQVAASATWRAYGPTATSYGPRLSISIKTASCSRHRRAPHRDSHGGRGAGGAARARSRGKRRS